MAMWKQEKQEENRSTSDQADVEADGSAVQLTKAVGGEDVSAFVGKDVQFKGTITYNGTVRIDGSMEGEIHTEGVLLVGEDVVITAKVTAGTIVCQGKITGDICAKEKINLRAPAFINGGVKTPLISMEEGVTLNGNLEMTQGVRGLQRAGSVHAMALPDEPADIKKAS
jgi:cytoskeletal protein CcmA (bactofilin family)